MKIVGKDFCDYYDSCLGYGIDKTIIYQRTIKEYEYGSKLFKETEKLLNVLPTYYSTDYYSTDYYIHKIYKNNKKEYYFESGAIGFCGIIYPFVKVFVEIKNAYQTKSKVIYFYNQDSLTKFLEKIKFKIKNKFGKQLFSKEFFKKLFKQSNNLDIFFKIGNPTWSIVPIHDRAKHIQTNYKLVINPKLEDYQFYKVFDSFTAFQEISMFIGGVLGQVHPMTSTISDEDMKYKKGFGHKYAFKTEPESMRK